jgi:APA family basic amino acid/polyamine antiporter
LWAVALVAGLTLVNFADLKLAARAQNLVVLAKLLALTLLILYGFSFLLTDASPEAPMTVSGSPPDPVTPAAVTWGALASSLMWISFSYAGYNAAIYVAGVASQGRRSVPRSMWLATLAVTAIYLGLNAIFLYVPPLEAIRGEKEIALIAARSLGGFWLGETVRGVVLVSLATSVLAMVQIGPHVYAQMARDRFLPGWLDTSQPTPRLGVLLQAFLAIFLIVYTDLLELLDYLAFLLSVSSAATAGCLLLPRFRGEPGNRPVWGWPWLPLCFIAATLAIAGMAFQYRLQSDPKSLLLALGLLPLGGLVYAVARRWGGAGPAR